MARGRVGGTHGLISGKVGDIIYSITRNPDGSYRQKVGSVPSDPTYMNTDEQARARLTMATIERAMFTFRDMMGTGFEGVDSGTNSVSKFSELNYNKFKEDIASAWALDMPDFVRCDLPLKGQAIPKDGEFIISQGTLRHFVGFNGSYGGGNRPHFNWTTIRFNNYTTLKEALWQSGVYIGDQIACFMFGKGRTPKQSMVVWWVMYTDPGLSPKTYIDESNFREYLKFNSNVQISVLYDNSDKGVHVIANDLSSYGISNWGCIGWRRRAVKGGIIRYSTQSMEYKKTDPWGREGWLSVPDVKDSWLNI